MEIDDCDEYSECSDEIHHVGKILSIESFFQSPSFIAPSEQEMEKTDDCTLEFRATSSVDGSRRECFPYDILADIGCNEQ